MLANLLGLEQVGADGAKSQVREIAGVKTNYSQSAVICTVEHTIENHCAWQRFLPSGPIALLPIGDKFSNIVWTMKPEESLAHKSMNEDDFINADWIMVLVPIRSLVFLINTWTDFLGLLERGQCQLKNVFKFHPKQLRSSQTDWHFLCL